MKTEYSLTVQQAIVLQLVAGGMTSAEIAREMHISPRTVDFHRGNVYTEAGCLVLGIENASLHLNDLIEKSDNLYAFVCDYVDGNWDCAAEHERDERAWKLKQLYAEDTAGDNEIDTEQSASTFNPEEWEITIAPGSSCELAELDDNQISRSYPGRTDCHLHATRVGFPDIGDVDAQFGRYPNMKNVPWHLVKGYPDFTEVSE